MTTLIEQKRSIPLSVTIASGGMWVLSVLEVVALATNLELDFNATPPAAQFIALAIAVGVGTAPAIVTWFGFKRGRRWVPVVLTVAAVWAAMLLSSAGPVLSWVGLGVAVASISSVWISPTRQFLRDIRDSASSGLR